MHKLNSVRSAFNRWKQDKSAVAAIEFALILPLMVVIIGGVVEINRAYNANTQLTRAANYFGYMLSQNQSSTLSVSDYRIAWRATAVNFPQVMQSQTATANWNGFIGSQVLFTAFTYTGASGCANPINAISSCYTVQNQWLILNDTGGVVTNSNYNYSYYNCNTAVPSALYGINGVYTVNLAYIYTPTIFSNILPSIRMGTTQYFTTRTGTNVSLDSQNLSYYGSSSTICT